MNQTKYYQVLTVFEGNTTVFDDHIMEAGSIKEAQEYIDSWMHEAKRYGEFQNRTMKPKRITKKLAIELLDCDVINWTSLVY